MKRLRGRPRPPYKLLSLLLQYPGDDLLAARADLVDAAGDVQLPAPRFLSWYAEAPDLELQQRYVETFDLQRRASLHLTYFTHGDTRQRGQALLRLRRLYAAAGLPAEPGELPDYLPLVLEFAAFAPPGVGEGVLGEHRAGLELLRLHLGEVGSIYGELLDAVCAGLPRLQAPELGAVRRLLREGPPTEQVGLQPFAPPEVMPGARP